MTARLAAIAALGLAVRLVYALVVLHGVGVGGDGLEFHLLANGLADGHGYREPLAPHIATADKPPLYPLLLAIPSLVGLDGVVAHRVVSCLMGAVLVVLVGLLGRRVGGDRVGLVAAALTAVYPLLFVLDGSVRSESLYAPLIAATLLAAYRLVDLPSVRRAVVLGALIGLATLTRSEALALLVLLVVPLLWLVPRGARLRALAACCAACAVVLAPWVVRNWIQFDRPLLSTNNGSLAYGANCGPAYYSRLIGTWPCFPRSRPAPGQDEAEFAAGLRRQGLDYARDHSGRVPAVAAVRLLRSWDFWSPRANTRLEAAIDNRDLAMHRAGVLVYWLLLPLAVAGGVLLRRRAQPLRILLAPAALVVLVSALAYGTTRFRVPAEISIVVLASVAVVRPR